MATVAVSLEFYLRPLKLANGLTYLNYTDVCIRNVDANLYTGVVVQVSSNEYIYLVLITSSYAYSRRRILHENQT